MQFLDQRTASAGQLANDRLEQLGWQGAFAETHRAGDGRLFLAGDEGPLARRNVRLADLFHQPRTLIDQVDQSSVQPVDFGLKSRGDVPFGRDGLTFSGCFEFGFGFDIGEGPFGGIGSSTGVPACPPFPCTLPLDGCQSMNRIFSRSVGLLGKLAPVHKSFDINPLAILVQADPTSAPREARGASPAM